MLAVLAGIGLLGVAIGLGALAGAGRHVPTLSFGTAAAAVALGLEVVADLLILAGGWRMARGEAAGRGLVALGVLVALASAVAAGGAGLAFEVLVLLLIYGLLVVSRLPEPAPSSDDPR